MRRLSMILVLIFWYSTLFAFPIETWAEQPTPTPTPILSPTPGLSPTPTPDPTRIQQLEEALHQTQKELSEAEKNKFSKESKLQEVEEKKKEVETGLQGLQANLSTAQDNLTQTLVAIDQKTRQVEAAANLINLRTQELNQKKDFLNETLRTVYSGLYVSNLTLFLTADNFADASKNLVYRQSVLNETKRLIDDLNQQIAKLKKEKNDLEQTRQRLIGEKQALQAQKQQLENEIVSTQNQIAALQNQQTQLVNALAGLSEYINSLTAKQQEILAQKAAAALASTTVGDFEIRRAVIEKEPPDDGQLYFSFWTYGYPHRVGMSQYGAYGRAKAGQSAREILKAYFAGVEIRENYPVPDRIKVIDSQGVREIAFEDDYLMGIGEMPSCWGDDEHGGFEALRAQAIAARSYALSYTGGGASPICIDQKCQVYVGSSKTSGSCGDRWRAAVESTRGQVITYQNEPISAWYASTAGGFTLSSQEVWGKMRPYAVGMADLDAGFEAYDGPKYGDSPWYHRAWGSEPWLSVDQITDILNAALLPDSYNNRLARADKGGFSLNQVVEALQTEGIRPVADLKSIEIFGANSRATAKLRVYYGDTYTEIDPARFRFVFNLRSPGTDAIWTSRFDLLTNR